MTCSIIKLVMLAIMNLLIMIVKMIRLSMHATREIEHLTKELNTLKLAHENQQEDHRELLRTHEKLRFEKINLEEEHEFLKSYQ